MTTLKRLPLSQSSRNSSVCSAILLASLQLGAATYFIDFEGGDDTSDGLSIDSAWQHCPGDENATGQPGAIELAPGDEVIFKGGVRYEGSISVEFDGTEEQPIHYRGNTWPGLEDTHAIIDGARFIGGWQQCETAAEAFDNPNYANIYYTYLPVEVSPLNANLHEADESSGEEDFLWLAQNPNLSDPFFWDNYLEYLPVTNENLSRTTITAPDVFNQSDPDHWSGSHLAIWVNPNQVVIREIDSFDPETDTVQFEELGDYAIYPDERDQYFSIYNSPHALDQPGEYFVQTTPEPDGTYKAYLWPHSSVDLDTRISASVRKFGIDLGSHDYIAVEGFFITKMAGASNREGIGIGQVTGSSGATGHTIRDNVITHLRNTGNGYGGIYIAGNTGSLIENNTVSHCPRTAGIFCNGGSDLMIRGNRIIKVGRTNIRLYTCENAQVIGNEIRENHGNHANGITIYIASRNILVANNDIRNSGTPITFQDSGNLYFINNLVDASGLVANVNEWGLTNRGPWATGEIVFLHNTFINNSNHTALSIGGRGFVVQDDFDRLGYSESEVIALMEYLDEADYLAYRALGSEPDLIHFGNLSSAAVDLTQASDLVLDPEYESIRQEIYEIIESGFAKYPRIAKNNITDGGMVDHRIDRSHNIFTGLAWYQADRYGWSCGEGSTLEADLNALFLEPGNGDFRLSDSSLAIAMGIDVSEHYPTETFPDFDFSVDYDGGQRKRHDVGAYRYRTGAERWLDTCIPELMNEEDGLDRDSDGDGMRNLFEYACDLDPTVDDRASCADRIAVDALDQLRLCIRRDDPRLSFVCHTSTDLETWIANELSFGTDWAVEGTEFSIIEATQGSDVLWDVTLEASSSAAGRFYQLEAVYVEP